jgi:hypothetical protein
MLPVEKIHNLLQNVDHRRVKYSSQRALIKLLKAEGAMIQANKLGVKDPSQAVRNLRRCNVPVVAASFQQREDNGQFKGQNVWYKINTNRCSERSVRRVLDKTLKGVMPNG